MHLRPRGFRFITEYFLRSCSYSALGHSLVVVRALSSTSQGGGGAQDMSDETAKARGGSSALQLDDIVSKVESATARRLQ